MAISGQFGGHQWADLVAAGGQFLVAIDTCVPETRRDYTDLAGALASFWLVRFGLGAGLEVVSRDVVYEGGGGRFQNVATAPSSREVRPRGEHGG